MFQTRKPSSVRYDDSGRATRSEESNFSLLRILRPVLSKTAIAWACTLLLVIVSFSFILNGAPDGSGLSPVWAAKTDDRLPSMSAGVENGQIQDKEQWQSSNEMDTPAPLHSGEETVTVTGEGVPLISTNGQGKVVMLTGATGPGYFRAVHDFFNKIFQNRRDYARAHGLL